ncbi:hypothetical protein JTB14_036116 [Gonioctena quinquepunctata]|nr:hypothetical protein JTB14_036116 [Gonioctena quinquepunctata]
MVKWKDRREILAIFSEYNAQLQNFPTKHQVKCKSQLVNEYEEYTAGVDNCDQILAYYTCEHQILIWYKKLGIHIFQLMLLNTYYLYKQRNPNNRRNIYDYRLCVIQGFLGPIPEELHQKSG